jgi:CRISPR/Cas system CSM-associated protein Csm3 (group 7 of RAMP superfamily)
MTTPGGVSAPEEQDWQDTGDDIGTRVRNILPLRRDPAGHEHIPGTTIAGSLRAHCRGTAELAGMFGPEPGEPRAASPIQVLGTVLTPVVPVEHTRTAVDRHRGAPRGSTLRTIELLPAGTEFTVMLRWNDAPDAGLAALRAQLRVWAPTIGRGASIGAGRCVVTGIGEQTYDLSTEDGLVAWLAIRGPEDYPPLEPVTPPQPKSPLRTVTLRVVDALHIGSGQTTPGAQGQEVALIVSRGKDFVIPGSGLKGILRARAEYICRSLGVDACDDAVCGACRPCRIFGHGAANRGDPMRRAAIAVPDAIVGHPVVEERQHVTIDRFTGGAAHELLSPTKCWLPAGSTSP